MKAVNIHDAKTRLSRLVEEAAKGEPFIIEKAGKPMVKVVPLGTTEQGAVRRTGFLPGAFVIPDDFDRLGQGEIEEQFGAAP